MLAFNLGIFFSNLRGAEVSFSAHSPALQLHFIGKVLQLEEHVELAHSLSVALSQGALACHIFFEDGEDEEPEEDAEVQVKLVQKLDGADVVLVETRFRFDQISLKPRVDDESPPPQPDPPEVA